MPTRRTLAFLAAVALGLGAACDGSGQVVSPGRDAGTPGPDAGPPEPDAGTPGPDAGPPEPDAGTPGPDAGTPGPDGSDGGEVCDDGTCDPNESCSTCEADCGACPPPATAASWIIDHFAGAPVVTGDFTSRQNLEIPVLVRDATACCSKYAFFMRDDDGVGPREAGFLNVAIADLSSTDSYGGGIATSRDFPGAVLFLANVTIEPNWPTWQDYATTNYDGVLLDGSEATYAEDLTITNWNADSAMDIKSNTIQLVRLTTQGSGNRTLRFWRPGPHYLVDSEINNSAGAIIWAADCATITINVYGSRFNGADTVPASKVSCEAGSAPTFVYLTVDPRTTGEMHPMFAAP
jgi:hypothetical protein